MKFAVLSSAAIMVAFVAICEGYPNYYFSSPPENWKKGERGPMGTGALRDGTDFNGACRFRTVNWLKDYKPGKIYAFRVMSSIKLGFKIKLVPEDRPKRPGFLWDA